jgi:ketosteroid isomerase-like protein
MKENTTISPVTQRNIDTIHAWLGAHNRQDMRAIDCYTEDIEIVEVPTGVVYKGRDKMRELARMAYRRKAWKDLTQIIATDTEACVEYAAPGAGAIRGI